MNDPNKQRLAEALSAMSAGETAPPDPATDDVEASASSDETATIAPPLPPAIIGKHLHVGVSRIDASIRMKRTLIPILLTLGVLLPVTASLKWLSPPESPFTDWSSALAWTILIVGVALLAAAVMNMLQVRQMLSDRAARGLTQTPRAS